jgi:hypothetical protein
MHSAATAFWLPLDTFPPDRRCPLEYKISMQTVVETPSYLKAAEKLLSQAEREDIVTRLQLTLNAVN